mgnify:CR=1 FL=1
MKICIKIQISCKNWYLKIKIIWTLFSGYIIFTGFALKINFSEGLIPLVLGCLTAGLLAFDWTMKKYESKINEKCSQSTLCQNSRCQKALKWFIGLAVFITFISLLFWDIFGGDQVKSLAEKYLKYIIFQKIFIQFC